MPRFGDAGPAPTCELSRPPAWLWRRAMTTHAQPSEAPTMDTLINIVTGLFTNAFAAAEHLAAAPVDPLGWVALAVVVGVAWWVS